MENYHYVIVYLNFTMFDMSVIIMSEFFVHVLKIWKFLYLLTEMTSMIRLFMQRFMQF